MTTPAILHPAYLPHQPASSVTERHKVRDYLVNVLAWALLSPPPKDASPAQQKSYRDAPLLVLEYDAGHMPTTADDLTEIVADMHDTSVSDYDLPTIPALGDL